MKKSLKIVVVYLIITSIIAFLLCWLGCKSCLADKTMDTTPELAQNPASSSVITGHQSIPQADIPKPEVLAPFIDPAFGSGIVRITNAKRDGFPGIVPDYSKRQAWNSDESLLMLRSCDGRALLFDGNTYQFKKVLEGVEGEDVFWHPENPDVVISSIDSSLFSTDVRNGEQNEIFNFEGYTFANTRGEGNLSADGRYYALVGQVYNEVKQEVRFKDLLMFDLEKKEITAKLPLPDDLNDFDWVSVSPDGKFVVVDYADDVTGRFHGVEIYDNKFNFLWQKPLGAGHSDIGINENGDDVLIMAVYDSDTNSTFIKQYRLKDGKETNLLELDMQFDLHISCRNEQNPGWCAISTFDYVGRLTDSKENWLPFEDEIFTLKMDGSGKVKRIAHHHSKRFDEGHPDSDTGVYFAEPHATISRKGNRIIFGSNWRENIGDETGIDTYVAEIIP